MQSPNSYSPPGHQKTPIFQLFAITVEETDFIKISSIFKKQSFKVSIKSFITY